MKTSLLLPSFWGQVVAGRFEAGRVQPGCSGVASRSRMSLRRAGQDRTCGRGGSKVIPPFTGVLLVAMSWRPWAALCSAFA